MQWRPEHEWSADELAHALGVTPGEPVAVGVLDEEALREVGEAVGEGGWATYAHYAAARAGWAALLRDAGARPYLVPIDPDALLAWASRRGIDPNGEVLDVFASTCCDGGIPFVPCDDTDAETRQVLDLSVASIVRRSPVGQTLDGRMTPLAHAVLADLAAVTADPEVGVVAAVVASRGSVQEGALWPALTCLLLSPVRSIVRSETIGVSAVTGLPAPGPSVSTRGLASALSLATAGSGLFGLAIFDDSGNISWRAWRLGGGQMRAVPAAELGPRLGDPWLPGVAEGWPMPTSPRHM